MLVPHLVKPASARRDELLDIAQRLFGEKGYEATSISDIAAAGGIQEDGFYRHFGSKEDLVEALACRFARATAARTEPLLHDPAQDAFSKLSAFLAALRRYKLESAQELRATFAPMFRAENLHLYERTQRAVVDVVRPILTRIIADGVAERTFDTTDPETAAETIMHLLTANRDLIAQLHATRDHEEFRGIMERLLVKTTFLSTVVDRILGLPEGSIELVDREAFEVLASALNGTTSIA